MSDDISTLPLMVAMATTATFLAKWSILALLALASRRRLKALGFRPAGARYIDSSEWLSLKQLNSLDRHGYFDVVGSETATRHRIDLGTALNIEPMRENGRSLGSWCVVSKGDLVARDVMLAQKIALETDERGTLSVAVLYAGARSRMMF